MEYNPLSMRPPEAIFCLRDPEQLCVEGICPHYDDLAETARDFYHALDEAYAGNPGDPEAAERAADEATWETDQALSQLCITNCRPVDPHLQ